MDNPFAARSQPLRIDEVYICPHRMFINNVIRNWDK